MSSSDIRFEGEMRIFLKDERDIGRISPHNGQWAAFFRSGNLADEVRESRGNFPDPESALEWMLSHPSLRGDLTLLPGARQIRGQGIALVFWEDGAGRRLALLEKSNGWGLLTGAALRTRRNVRIALLQEQPEGRDFFEMGLSEDADGWRLHRGEKATLGPWPTVDQAFKALAKVLSRDSATAHQRLRIMADSKAWADRYAQTLVIEADPAAHGAVRPEKKDSTATFRLTRGDGAAVGKVRGGPGRWTAIAETPLRTSTTPESRTFLTVDAAMEHLRQDPRLAFDGRTEGARHLRGTFALSLGASDLVAAILRPHEAAHSLGLKRPGRLLAVAWKADSLVSLPDAYVFADPEGRLRLYKGHQDRGRRLKDATAAAIALAEVAGGASAHAALDLARTAAETATFWWDKAERLRMSCLLETPEWEPRTYWDT